MDGWWRGKGENCIKGRGNWAIGVEKEIQGRLGKWRYPTADTFVTCLVQDSRLDGRGWIDIAQGVFRKSSSPIDIITNLLWLTMVPILQSPQISLQ